MTDIAIIIVERYTPVPRDHILPEDAPNLDRLILKAVRKGRDPVDLRLSVPCRSFASHPSERSTPYILPQFTPAAYCFGKHGDPKRRRQRDAIVNQGLRPIEAKRLDGTTVGVNSRRPEDFVGLNIHDWRDSSNGCITVQAAYWKRVIDFVRYVDSIPLEGMTYHPDGRRLWTFCLKDLTGRKPSYNLHP